MEKIILFFLTIIFSVNAFSQAPAIEWQKCLGGSYTDMAFSIDQTSDGGYVVTGQSFSNNGNVTGHHGGSTNYFYDYWVAKLNSNGILQWQKSLGGTDNDNAYSIKQTLDAGYIVVGASQSLDGDVTGHHGSHQSSDYWIVKLDSAGTIQWQRSYGGTFGDAAQSVQLTSDRGYIVAGYANSNDSDVTANHGGADYWILKLDSLGSIQWQKSLGGTNNDIAYSIQQTSDHGYIVAGQSLSNDGDIIGNHGGTGCFQGCNDYWVVKLDSMGSIQWQKSLGGTNNDIAQSVQVTLDNGYIIAGRSLSTDGDVTGHHMGTGCTFGCFDYWIVKLDNNGSIQWQKSLGGTEDDEATSIQQAVDGGYVVVGHTNSNDSDVTGLHIYIDYWAVKLDSSGIIQWQKCLGGGNPDYATSIKQTTDDGYIIAGYSNSIDGDVAGMHISGYTDYWVVKLVHEGVGINKISNAMDDISLFPNPATTELRIENAELKIKTIEIYSSLGEKIYSGQPETSNKQRVTISVADFSPGIYFIRVTDQAGNKVTKKVVKM